MHQGTVSTVPDVAASVDQDMMGIAPDAAAHQSDHAAPDAVIAQPLESTQRTLLGVAAASTQQLAQATWSRSSVKVEQLASLGGVMDIIIQTSWDHHTYSKHSAVFA